MRETVSLILELRKETTDLLGNPTDDWQISVPEGQDFIQATISCRNCLDDMNSAVRWFLDYLL